MRWATRVGVHVDRTASAWLIRRMVDPEAEFVFVHDPDEVPADATPFDMRGVELSHRGGGCTFETMLASYGIDDPALEDIARIIHEADLDDERFDAPEAPRTRCDRARPFPGRRLGRVHARADRADLRRTLRAPPLGRRCSAASLNEPRRGSRRPAERS
jgi:hypothetical protein